MRFKVGDRVVVTGDDAGTVHELDSGMAGKVIETGVGIYYEDCNGAKYPADEVFRILTDHDGDHWDVHEMDLMLEYSPVTDQELAEVYKSLGVAG